MKETNILLNKDEFTILVVDDELEVVNLLVSILEEEGYKVVSTQNGREALGIVKNQKIDILLLDYFMPGFTGEQVVTEIRNFDKEIIILLQTGYSGEKPPREMLKILDIQGYHDKTEGMEKLLIWVESCTRTCALLRENKRMFEDVVLAHQTIESVKRNQEKLVQQERLASLGELMGSISSSITDRVFCVMTALDAMEKTVEEYKSRIDNSNEANKQQIELESKLRKYITNAKKNSENMRKVTQAVQKQGFYMNDSSNGKSFKLDTLVHNAEIMMQEELTMYSCTLNKNLEADMNTEIEGELSALIHVITNIIKNAIDSYEGKGGRIEFNIIRSGDNIEFSVKDYGKGIAKEVQEKLFYSMVSTKGTNGTGLGLYVSSSIIKSKFEGEVWFETEEGKGTAFYIKIPCVNKIQVKK